MSIVTIILMGFAKVLYYKIPDTNILHSYIYILQLNTLTGLTYIQHLNSSLVKFYKLHKYVQFRLPEKSQVCQLHLFINSNLSTLFYCLTF